MVEPVASSRGPEAVMAEAPLRSTRPPPGAAGAPIWESSRRKSGAPLRKWGEGWGAVSRPGVAGKLSDPPPSRVMKEAAPATPTSGKTNWLSASSRGVVRLLSTTPRTGPARLMVKQSGQGGLVPVAARAGEFRMRTLGSWKMSGCPATVVVSVLPPDRLKIGPVVVTLLPSGRLSSGALPLALRLLPPILTSGWLLSGASTATSVPGVCTRVLSETLALLLRSRRRPLALFGPPRSAATLRVFPSPAPAARASATRAPPLIVTKGPRLLNVLPPLSVTSAPARLTTVEPLVPSVGPNTFIELPLFKATSEPPPAAAEVPIWESVRLKSAAAVLTNSSELLEAVRREEVVGNVSEECRVRNEPFTSTPRSGSSVSGVVRLLSTMLRSVLVVRLVPSTLNSGDAASVSMRADSFISRTGPWATPSIWRSPWTKMLVPVALTSGKPPGNPEPGERVSRPEMVPGSGVAVNVASEAPAGSWSVLLSTRK